MIQEIVDLLPGAITHLHAPIALTIASVGLLIGLVGARFSRAIIALALVSAGTVIGLHMPKWFGWGIDPMGTAFGMAIVLGISGYMLTTLWEGVLFATVLSAGAAAGVWIDLTPGQAWHWPQTDWSSTALEIAAHVRLSLPSALTTVLPVALGIGATVGALVVVIWHKLGRVLLYGVLGMALMTLSGVIGLNRIHPEWLIRIPQDGWIQGGFFALLVIFSACVQWLLLPGIKNASASREIEPSDNKLQFNHFVAKGPALRVQAAEKRVLIDNTFSVPSGARPRIIPARIK